MKKRIIVIMIAVLAALALLFPIPLYADDGGTVKYQAVLYSVTNYHNIRAPGEVKTGIEIIILGLKVYSNTTIQKG